MPPQKPKGQPRPSPLDEPPTASSSSSSTDEENNQHPSSPLLLHGVPSSADEEEAASEDSEEEEEASPHHVSKNPPSNPPSNPQQQSSSSGSETESESEPDPTPLKVKPPLKPQSSPGPSKSASKRPAENSNNADPKRAKKATDSSFIVTSAAPASDEEAKKPGDMMKKFPRVWTEEEEVALVKGVSDFSKKTGQDPLKPTNFTAFFNFVRKSMYGEPSLMQVKDKIRRLKKKYETLAAKGDPPTFVKPHDEKIFELAKKVWGPAADLSGGSPNGSVDRAPSNGNAGNTSKKKETVNKSKPELVLAVMHDANPCKMQIDQKPQKKASPDNMQTDQNPQKKASSDNMQTDQNPQKKASPDKMQTDQKPDGCDVSLFLRELARFKEGVIVGNIDEDDLKRGLELIGESKRAELSGRWKKLQHAEMKLLANRLELIGEQTKLILEALRSSDH